MKDRRALFVHAHPDDESSQNGVTLARLVDEGVQVTLVTCTLGEEGEVLVPELAELASSRSDRLGPHRLQELTAAMAILGVTDFVRLGGDGRYRDSGMVYDEAGLAKAGDEVHADAFWRADLLAASLDLVPIIRDRRPQVVITYDQFGNYGHPDHVMAHRVATYATVLAGVPGFRPDLGEPWSVQRFYWSTMSASTLREGLRYLRSTGDTETFAGLDPDGPMPPMATEDADIAVTVPAGEYGERKLRALEAHATQVDWEGPFFSMFRRSIDGPGGAEHYRLAAGVPIPGGHSDDLFAGLECE